MNFILAEQLFFFSIRASHAILSYMKPVNLNGKSESEILLEKAAKIGSLIDSIYKDGKVDLSDIPEIFSILKEATVFIGFNFEEAAIQIANASKEDMETMFKKFDEEFVLNDKCKEANLEILLHEIFSIINSGSRILKICEKIKK